MSNEDGSAFSSNGRFFRTLNKYFKHIKCLRAIALALGSRWNELGISQHIQISVSVFASVEDRSGVLTVL